MVQRRGMETRVLFLLRRNLLRTGLSKLRSILRNRTRHLRLPALIFFLKGPEKSLPIGLFKGHIPTEGEKLCPGPCLLTSTKKGEIMFKTTRKFLILAVMLACLYALPVSNNVSANACCDSCDAFYNSCMSHCTIEFIKEDEIPFCEAACESDYMACGNLCPGPPMGCSHPQHSRGPALKN